MIENINSNFATINTEYNLINLYKNELDIEYGFIVLRDCKIEFDENPQLITITGKKYRFVYNYERKFLEDLDFLPESKFVVYKHKNVIDFFRGIKKPCIERTFVVDSEKEPFKMIMSSYMIIFNND